MAQTKRARAAIRRFILTRTEWELRNYFRDCLTFRWADRKGITGNKGGWLKSRTGKTMAQGYGDLYKKYREHICIDFWGMDCGPHSSMRHLAEKREQEMNQ